MDSTTLTHVAAILVGVSVTLLLVGFGKKGGSEKEVAAVSSPAGTSSAASKKKKKKKGKGNNAPSNTESNALPKQAPAAKKQAETAEAPAAANDGNKGANGSSSNKTKKKKKTTDKKPATPAATNGSASTNINKENDASAAVVEQKEEESWQSVPSAQPKEEEWVVEGSKKKKKNQRPKKAAAPAEAAAAAPAAVASVSDTIAVDAKKVGIIIGPKGATMQAIQEATGCQLDINAPPKDDARATKAGVVISGPDKEAIAKAKKAVNELATKGYATLLQSDNFGEYSISVHPRFLSEIVGPSGRTIQAIQKTLDVKITIPPTDWKPNAIQVGQVKPAMVGIAGSKENSKTAKAVIQSLMKYHHHEITHPGMIHEEVYVPSEFFHCVIGPRGSEIKHIRGNYKVDIYMPGKEDSTQENVIVVGMQKNVDKAISYIQLLMDRDSEQRERKYNDEFYD